MSDNTMLIKLLHTEAIIARCYDENISVRRVGEILSYSVLPTQQEDAILRNIFGVTYVSWSLSDHINYLKQKVRSIQPWGHSDNGQVIAEVVSNLTSLQKILQEKGM